MKTGPHSFTDATGVEWDIVGYYRVPGYADCRSKDGKAMTLRPLAYLGPAGLSVPPDAPPPERAATAAEKKAAAELYEAMPSKDIVPEDEQVAPPKPKRKRAAKKTAPSLEEPVDAAAPASSAPEGTPEADGAGGAELPTTGRYVLYRPPAKPEGLPALVTSWDTWTEAHVAFPIPADTELRDDATGEVWIGPCECECGDCCHARYGCIECGDKTGVCTPTKCASPSNKPSAAVAAVPARARVVNMHRDGWDVDISRNGPWGNPYSHLPDSAAQYVVETRERAIDLYREWMRQRVRDGEPGLVQALASLHGLRLGCYCAPEPCHGEVLADAAEWAHVSISSQVVNVSTSV